MQTTFRLSFCLFFALFLLSGCVEQPANTVANQAKMDELIAQGAQGMAVAIAGYIMEDIEAYKNFAAEAASYKAAHEGRAMPIEAYQHSAYYKKMQSYFATIKEHSSAKYIYTMQRIDAENMEFILDGEAIGTEDHSPPGTGEPNGQWEELCFTSKKPVRSDREEYERWGELISAYAPIFDEDGETVLGIVGVDVEVSPGLFAMD